MANLPSPAIWPDKPIVPADARPGQGRRSRWPAPPHRLTCTAASCGRSHMCECALPRALIPVTHPLATIGGENAQVADGVRWSFAYRDSLSCVAINGLRGLGLPGIDAR